MGADSLLVFNTGFTVDLDGPGQRLVFYLKGCNMRCPWCAAPESVSPHSDVLFFPHRLDDPTRAVVACPQDAIAIRDGNISRDVSLCYRCEEYACLRGGLRAFEWMGERVPISDLVGKARRYRMFYGPTGGVTLGGGEPTCQFDGAARLLSELRAAGIHTAMETNGSHVRLPELFDLVDALYLDLKHPDDAECERLTGVGCAQTLENIRRRHAHGGMLTVRLTLVPGYNCDEATLKLYAQKLSAIGPLAFELIPYHRRGEAKWKALGLKMPTQEALPPSGDLLRQGRSILLQSGLIERG
ncbi:MAG: glycyl-radical enzyme activating protein [Candidatus Sumerlaeota bacterium]|nr:glycyl-radical enzyme activating protein [Candidatus Sumerlaeota bacterium]